MPDLWRQSAAPLLAGRAGDWATALGLSSTPSLLRREDERANLKRIYRGYRSAGLVVRGRRKKRRALLRGSQPAPFGRQGRRNGGRGIF